MGMTLRNLETYGYISSKTKNYQILRRFVLLFIFHAFWPYKAGLPSFLDQQALLLITLLRPSFSGFSKFLDLFSNKPLEAPKPLLKSGFCPNNFWIMTEYFVIHFLALNFSYSDRINHPTRSKYRTLWQRWHSTVPYLLYPASHSIGYQAFLVPNWRYDLKKALN